MMREETKDNEAEAKQDTAQSLKALGNARLAAKDYSAAIAHYTQALVALVREEEDDAGHDSDNNTNNTNNDNCFRHHPPSLRAVLLSNRSHAYLQLLLSAGDVDSASVAEKALADATVCAQLQPEWPKAHVRRAKALLQLQQHQQQKQTQEDKEEGNNNNNNNNTAAALEAYDDALAAVERCLARVGNNNNNNNTTTKQQLLLTKKEIKASRKQCARELRGETTGPSQLSKEVSDMGCLLVVPDDSMSIIITESYCIAATLEPATYDGVDDRTQAKIHADFPGDQSGWPMFVPVLFNTQTQKRHNTFPPLCYYIIGPCTLTQACADEIDDIFRPLPHQHACRWPGGPETRTCPFCAKAACLPTNGSSGSTKETFTMLVHLLMGKATGGFGIKLMMQLVCERCTRKCLAKATSVDDLENDDEARQWRMVFDNNNATETSSSSVFDPLSRLRRLTDSSHAIKVSVLWNSASNTGLISSITLHAQQRLQRMMTTAAAAAGNSSVARMATKHNSGSYNATAAKVSSGGDACEFFDTWMAGLDERAIYKKYEKSCKFAAAAAAATITPPSSSSSQAQGDAASSSRHIREQLSSGQNRGRSIIGNQEFHIRQVARIKDLQKALGVFWNRHGAGFRLQWSTWDEDQQKVFAFTSTKSFVNARIEHYNRRHTQYFHIEDIGKLVHKPFGDIPSEKLCFLPELAGSSSASIGDDKQYDLLQLFLGRVAGEKTWVAEDVALIADLKKKNSLPRLQYKEEDGSYLCDYMGLRDSSIGPFVVLVGDRAAEYNAKGTSFSSKTFLNPEEVVKLAQYRSLCEPFAENVTIWNAVSDGEVSNALNNLLSSGTATCAVCYIYAAMRQTLLLEYLQSVAQHYCIAVEKDDPKDLDSWSHSGIAYCYVCAARTRADGSKLFCCSKCRKINYCSPECQRTDWPRHKVESCITSPNVAVGSENYQSTATTKTTGAPSKAKNAKKKGKKGKKKGKKS